jgi:hypothetical protein
MVARSLPWRGPCRGAGACGLTGERGARLFGPGRGRQAAGPCDAGPPRARARRPICRGNHGSFTDPVSAHRELTGRLRASPGSSRCFPRQSAPNPGRTSSAPRFSPERKCRAIAALFGVAVNRGSADDLPAEDAAVIVDRMYRKPGSGPCAGGRARPVAHENHQEMRPTGHNPAGAGSHACMRVLDGVCGTTSGAQTMLARGRADEAGEAAGGPRARAQTPPRPCGATIQGR